MAVRTDRRVPLDLYINKMINGVPHLARTKDISEHGIYVHRVLEPTTPPDAHIALEFVLPNSEEVIWAEAEACHGCPDNGLGFRFVDLTPRQSQLICDFVAAGTC